MKFTKSLLINAAFLFTAKAALLDLRDDDHTVAGQAFNVWQALNVSVGGKLHLGEPFEKPCFSTFNGSPIDPDPMACATIQQNYTDPTFRVQQFGAYMQSQWETCQATGEGCLLDSSDPSDPLAFTGVNCQNGNVPPFYIDVRSVSDIQAAYNFSQATGVRLSVKNHGHDFKGRSSGKNTLSLWIKNLESSKMGYDAAFVPEQCSSQTKYRAITFGGGVLTEDVYHFADQNNITWIGGYHQTLGTGWVLGGGHSILSPVYGLGVDRVVQFKVVTADGVYRTANECQNSDLFWALRGGGGSAFGVVVESSHKVEPQLTLQAAIIKFPANSSNLSPWYNLTVENSLRWGNNGWGGHIVGPTLIHVTPKLNASQAQADMQTAIDYAVANGGTGIIDTLPSWYAFFQKYVVSAQAAIGFEAMLGTRLLSTSLFGTPSGKQQLAAAIQNMLPFASPYIVVGTPYLFNYTSGSTSVTPAWRNSLWHFGFDGLFTFNSTLAEKTKEYQQVTSHIQPFRDLTPGSGSYFNEGDVYEPNHEQSYWGTENYARLLSIKKKYDPQNLLTCWQCVGWNGANDPLYQCYIKV